MGREEQIVEERIKKIEALKESGVSPYPNKFTLREKRSWSKDIQEKNAEIAKASRIYEHGISAGKTAKMLGVSMYDLQNYTGQTGISEVALNQTINAKTRIKMLEELFSK